MSGIISSVLDSLQTALTTLGLDVLFILALAVEAIFVIFFLVKSSLSYESGINRGVDKLNFWLFQHKVITEENIQEFNRLVKNVTPKRFCYYWQQYILYREGNPSSYMSIENVVERPLKTSTYDANIKNLNIISIVWAIVIAFFFVLAGANFLDNTLSVGVFAECILIVATVLVINLIFTVLMRARKNSILNSIYQNISLFGRFMDNACIDLPTYIDYQILFTPQEIEKGQPVLREFLDYKTRREKEEFQKAQEENVDHEVYDFSSTGVSGSNVLDRAMKESEKYLNKKDKVLVQISQLENELDARKKNFDNVQKDYQTKLQASRENIDALLKQQEETTNRIESNYLRKQQTQEIAKQDQLEQEFEQQRAKYILEKNELEDEVKKLQTSIDEGKAEVERIMIGEYQNFFDSFCKSAEKVVGKVFADRFEQLKTQNKNQQEYITELEIKLKNTPQGTYDAAAADSTEAVTQETEVDPNEGHYDEAGNYVYPNGSYYDADGLYHDVDGKIYDSEGNYVGEGEPLAQEPVQTEETIQTEQTVQEETPAEVDKVEEPEEEKEVIDLDSLNAFDFMTDLDMKDDIYGVASNIINETDDSVEAYNSNVEDEPQIEPEEEELQEETENSEEPENAEESEVEEEEPQDVFDEDIFEDLTDENEEPQEENEEDVDQDDEETQQSNLPIPSTSSVPVVVEENKKRRGRPKKEKSQETEKSKRKPGRPRKIVGVNEEPEEEIVEEPEENKPKRGRPKKIVNTTEAPKEEKVEPKKRVGRPRKQNVEVQPEPEITKKHVGRPKKTETKAEVIEETPKKKVGRPKKVQESATPEVPEKRKAGRPKKDPNAPKNTTPRKKIVGKKEESDVEPKKKRGRPRKTSQETLDEINKKITETENKLAETRELLSRELESVMKNINKTNEPTEEDRKNEIYREIEELQKEAKSVNVEGSQEQIADINRKIEQLIEEVKKLNS